MRQSVRYIWYVATRYAGPDVIAVAEQECLAPMPGEVQLKVLAAADGNSDFNCVHAMA